VPRIRPSPGPADRLLRLLTAHALFQGSLAQILVYLLPEISDARPDQIGMVYVPEDRKAEPSLFPRTRMKESNGGR